MSGIGFFGFQTLVAQEGDTAGQDGAEVASLSFPEVAIVAGVMVLAFVATGALVLAFRRGYIAKQPEPKDATPKRQDLEGDTFVRSVLALWLVIGLMVITVVSFGLADVNLRSTLVGAVAASAGGAIAFYFSSKAASEARRDLLNVATDAQVEVPKIVGLTVAKARALFAEHTTLGLNAGTFADGETVAAQTPLPGDRVPRGTLVTIDSVTTDKQTGATDGQTAASDGQKVTIAGQPAATDPKPPGETQPDVR